MNYNKRNKKLIVVLALTILISSMLFSNQTSIKAVNGKIESSNPGEPPSLENSLPPLTDSPFGFNDLTGFQTYASNPGAAGSIGDRFIIEDYYINATGYQWGININETSYYFEIRDCIIVGGVYGIWLHKLFSNTAILYNNTIINSTIGCVFTDTNNHLIHFNDISGSVSGIHVDDYLGNFMIYNNTITSCIIGINGDRTEQMYIVNNTVSYCEKGILAFYNNDTWVTNNTVFECTEYGIEDVYSYHTHIDQNVLYDNSVGIEVYGSHYTQVIWNMVYDSVSHGISLRYTEETDVWHNHLYNDGFNIYDNNYTRVATLNFQNFNNYLNGKLVNLVVNHHGNYYTSEMGQIILYNCDSVLVKELSFSDSINAVTLVNCSVIGIWDSTFTDMYVPISLQHCTEAYVLRSSFVNNGYGLYAYESEQVDVTNSTFTANEIGTYYSYSDLSVFEGNTYENNTNYGIVLEYSDNNIIFHNNFIDNGNGSLPQCYDFYGSGNFWFSLVISEGNYWSEWVSGPYLIECELNDIFDLYPLGAPIVIIPEYHSLAYGITLLMLFSLCAVFLVSRKRK